MAYPFPFQLAQDPEQGGPRRLPRFRGNFAFHLRDIEMWVADIAGHRRDHPWLRRLFSPKVPLGHIGRRHSCNWNVHSQFSFERRLRDWQLVFLRPDDIGADVEMARDGADQTTLGAGGGLHGLVITRAVPSDTTGAAERDGPTVSTEVRPKSSPTPQLFTTTQQVCDCEESRAWSWGRHRVSPLRTRGEPRDPLV